MNLEGVFLKLHIITSAVDGEKNSARTPPDMYETLAVNNGIHSRKLTWNLKMMVSNRNLQTSRYLFSGAMLVSGSV